MNRTAKNQRLAEALKSNIQKRKQQIKERREVCLLSEDTPDSQTKNAQSIPRSCQENK